MNRIFFKTHTHDPKTNLPLYVFDSTFLPSPDLISYDQFIPLLLNQLPTTPYSLIFFSCGLNKISWIWGIRFLKNFLSIETNLNNLHKIYMIHDSWYVRSITEIMKNIKSTKKIINLNTLIETLIGNPPSEKSLNRETIIYCTDLSDLSKHIDITKIKISLNAYKFNYLLENTIAIPIHINKVVGQEISLSNPILFNHFYQLFNILDTNGYKIEYLFHNPGNKRNCDILLDCINRNQIIWINDWDLYCIGTVFKRILATLPHPLIPVEFIGLPIKDSSDVTLESFKKILSHHKQSSSTAQNYQILLQLFNFCHRILHNLKSTKHNSNTLAKCLSSCLSHESIHHSKDNLLIVNRFIKNVFENWVAIRESYKATFQSITYTISSQISIPKGDQNESKSDAYFNSYNMSYNLTADDDSEENLEYRIAMDTTNILHNLSNSNPNSKSNSSAAEIDTDKELLPPKVPPRRKRQFSDESESSQSSNSNSNHNSNSNPDTSPSSVRSDTSPPPSESKNLKSAVSTPQLRTSATFNEQPANETVKKQTSLPNLSSAGSSPNKLSYKSGIEKFSGNNAQSKPKVVKKPVIRGRKVGELTKLYEERLKGLEFINEL